MLKNRMLEGGPRVSVTFSVVIVTPSYVILVAAWLVVSCTFTTKQVA